MRYIKEKGIGFKDKNVTDSSIDLCHIGDNLDVAVIWGRDTKTREAYTNLDALIHDTWNIEEERPIFITNNTADHVRLRSLVKVEEPEFLLVDETIVDEGIKRGSKKLYEALKKKDGVMDLESAIDVAGEDYFINQFIKFEFPGVSEYARISASVTRNKNREMISFKDSKLELLS